MKIKNVNTILKKSELYFENQRLKDQLQQKENILKALEIWLSDKYYGRNGHMDSDVIGIKDVLNYINELKVVENNE